MRSQFFTLFMVAVVCVSFIRSSNGQAPVCSGQGTCNCDLGFTGVDCGKEVDWCYKETIEVDGHPQVQTICGDRGTCVSTWAGAKCICHPGFTGQFCDQLIPEELFLAKRCLAYGNETEHWSPSDQVGCSGKQECVPDDIQCLLTPCNDPIGWCLPNERAGVYSRNAHQYSKHANEGFQSFMSNNGRSAKNSASCSGHGQCQCNSGYTGDDCEKEVNWCDQSLDGVTPTAPIKDVCGYNGTCTSQPSGASCICEPGFTGQFCHEVIPTEVVISRRCYVPYPNQPPTQDPSVPIGCENADSCIPEDLQCLVKICSNPIGWCLPMKDVDRSRLLSFMKSYMIAQAAARK